jgi:hypothetical protein
MFFCFFSQFFHDFFCWAGHLCQSHFNASEADINTLASDISSM